MSDQVIIQEEVTEITILNTEGTTEVVTVKEPTSAVVITIAEQGPPGVQGNPGTSYNFIEEDFTIDNPLDFSYNLSSVPVTGSINVFLNGLRENKNNFDISGNVLSLDNSMILTNGDVLSVSYAVLQ
jgi:hypothetical protein